MHQIESFPGNQAAQTLKEGEVQQGRLPEKPDLHTGRMKDPGHLIRRGAESGQGAGVSVRAELAADLKNLPLNAAGLEGWEALASAATQTGTLWTLKRPK